MVKLKASVVFYATRAAYFGLDPGDDLSLVTALLFLPVRKAFRYRSSITLAIASLSVSALFDISHALTTPERQQAREQSLR